MIMVALLNLPAELRNRIYEFALTDTSSFGLTYRPYFDNEEWTPILFNPDGTTFNPLKHACRQIRAETANLDLHYNAILIDNNRHAPSRPLHGFNYNGFAVESSTGFAHSSTPSEQTWLNTAALAEWCAVHPKYTVHYRPEEFATLTSRLPENVLPHQVVGYQISAAHDAAKFIMSGVYFTIALRGQCWSREEWERLKFGFAILIYMPEEWNRERIEEVAEWSRDGWDVDEHGKVVNLKFFPKEREFDEGMREAVECLARIYGDNEGLRDEWVGLCEKWYTVGI
jgi:hypothetical protein